MYMPDIELHEATTLDGAAEFKARYAPNVRLLAGGTDLLVDLKARRINIDHIVSLNRINDLRGVSQTKEGLRIGALTTITKVGDSKHVHDRFSPILDATSRMAGPQIRNVATLGGNLACAVPCADFPPILTAMNASVLLWSPQGERRVPLETLIVDVRKTILRDDEVLTAVDVPTQPSGYGAAYAKFSLRDGMAIAVASVAAALTLNKDNTIRDARIVLGAVAPVPKLVESAATCLLGQPPDEAAFRYAAEIAMKAAEPICDIRGSADFRRELVGVLTQRALKTAFERAKETVA